MAKIRKAKLSELKTIQDLNKALFESDSDKDAELNMNWPYEDGKEYFEGAIKGTTGVCFVAEENGEIIGYLAGSIKKVVPSFRPVRRSEVENMLVKEEYRSKGIGAELMAAFIDWSRSNGIKYVFVQAYSSNTGAINFYKKQGFDPYSAELELTID